jgi:ATP phosphoribosyltransferase
MIAWPKESPEPLGKIKVATKFVNIAREYFDSQNRQVEIIKLSGALEIAPSLGLSDCIVDLVATGETLNANGMQPGDLIAEISSRLIVNRAALKTKFEEISVFTNLITSVASEAEGD